MIAPTLLTLLVSRRTVRLHSHLSYFALLLVQELGHFMTEGLQNPCKSIALSVAEGVACRQRSLFWVCFLQAENIT